METLLWAIGVGLGLTVAFANAIGYEIWEVRRAARGRQGSPSSTGEDAGERDTGEDAASAGGGEREHGRL